MSNKTVWVIIIILVLIGLYFWLQPSAPAASVVAPAATTEQPAPVSTEQVKPVAPAPVAPAPIAPAPVKAPAK